VSTQLAARLLSILGEIPTSATHSSSHQSRARQPRSTPQRARARQSQVARIGVLSMGEAAARLGMSRAQLEQLIDRGKVETLQLEFIRLIPSSEVTRLQHAT